MKKVAIFDIDGTIIKDISSERVFFKYLFNKRIITFKDLLRYAAMYLIKLFTFKGIYVRKNKFYIKGKKYDSIVSEAKKCFNDRLVKYISSDALEEIRILKSDGYKIILLSGTLDPLMECFKTFCKADQGIATSLKIVDGIITGEIDGIYAYHKGKTDVVRRLVNEEDIDLAKSYAYANEEIDIEFMQMAGNPVAVNADMQLKKHAGKNKWRIVEFN